MQRLPDVLLQFLMQLMRKEDRLLLARCSSQMMHAANSPAAWRHCSMLQCSTGRVPSAPLSSCHLLRHVQSMCGLSLRWPRMYKLTDSDCDRLLTAFAPIAELDFRECQTKRGGGDERISASRMQQILMHSALSQLRSLSLPVESSINAEMLQQLHQLPLLSYLHIAGSRPPKQNPWIWPALLTMPALTSLSTSLIFAASTENDVPIKGGLPSIIHLRMERAVFFTFGRQTRLRSLQSLTLCKWAANRVLQLDWTFFECLHSLHLRQFINLAEFLPPLRFLKPLRLLTISPVPELHFASSGPQSIESLIELLMLSPELRVTIFVVPPPFGRFKCPADVASLFPAESRELRSRMAQVTDRFSVKVLEPEQ